MIPSRVILAALSSLLLSASFPPLSLYPLVFLSLVPILLATRDLPPRAAFLLGLLFGVLHHAVLLYWLLPVMTKFGKMPLVGALATFFLLCLILGSYAGLVFAATSWAGLRAGLRGAIAFCALWVAGELLKGRPLMWFPWDPLGAALSANLVLVQAASLVTVFGLSAALAFSNYCVFSAISERRPLFLLGPLVVLVALAGYGSLTLKKDLEVKRTFTVAVVQGNIPQEEKWNPGREEANLYKYLSLTKRIRHCEPELVVWPETAATFVFPDYRYFSKRLLASVKRLKVRLLFGAPKRDFEDQRKVFRNAAFLVSDKGEILGVYEKERLVPFGEYVPFERWIPWLRAFAVTSGNYSPGRLISPLKVGDVLIGVLICFENVFPDLALKRVRDGAEVLVVITNDAWFGRSAALPQHFMHSVLRAVETRRFVIQVANTGISGVVDPFGRVVVRGPVEKEWTYCARISLP